MEFLLIFAGVGLLVSSIAVLVNNAQPQNVSLTKLNDARRLSDINQIRTGLELFQSQAGGYPDSHLWVTGDPIACGTKDAELIAPRDPAINGTDYTYKSQGNQIFSPGCATNVWSDYSLQFKTDTETYLGPAGTYCLTSNKVSFGECK